ncbi:MAG TPA: peptidyl-tRNA hydrolase Pth2 [Candidatus Nanoarchaeia archaeon]|nr:peptidyl-tRNA hydrolase Pth2 [Candidatus Nanoarchaeia archaeon]
MTTYKQVILVRQDLKLPKGKLAAQAAHASVEAVLKSDQKVVAAWRENGMTKIAMKVKDEKELLQYFQQAKDKGLTAALIIDAGRTVIAPGTKTCVGIGPDIEEKIDKITGKLSLL